jgi:hypothetical protein
MAVRLSALCIGRALLPRNIIFLFLVLISVRGKPQGKVRPEGLHKLNKFIHLTGLETATFRLVT